MAKRSQTRTKAEPRTEARRGRAPKAGPRTERPGPDDPNVLERGDVFFFYRPADEANPPSGLVDVNRFHMVLRPEGGATLRYLTIGKKKLPGEDDARNWGFVDGVFRDPEGLKGALASSGRAGARPAGEGVYALARSGRDTLLAYALELPGRPGEVQQALNIAPEGRFVLVIKNPEANAPAGVGLDEGRRAEFPEALKARFGDRKWVPADPPAFLDHEGAELLLIAGDRGGEVPGPGLEPQPEDEEHAEVFNDLRLERSERTIRPLFEGTWE
jgi:hypothetical protein